MPPSQGRLAARVGAGIMLTRVLGFVRERVFAHYFGAGVTADACRAALKIPNVIRNLLGEGTLSASLIPVYAGMIERGESEKAQRLAGVIASVLVLLTAVLAFIGIALAPGDALLVNMVTNYLGTLQGLGLLDTLEAKWFEDGAWLIQLP